MHFPQISRRPNYKKTRLGTDYANYREHLEEISEDCKNRCVYCDISMEEMGGEGMHLDHFQPKRYFPELATSPANLVLACPRCNALKSDWWPAATGECNGGAHGFIDPFDPRKYSCFWIDDLGFIRVKNAPYGYMIDLMTLNRPSRLAVRRHRILRERVAQLLQKLTAESQAIIQGGDDLNPHRARLEIIFQAISDLNMTVQKIFNAQP